MPRAGGYATDSHGIDVAVFGRFKAGKSSFLNSLTGRAVLPIGVVPLTAVVTRLRYGPAEKAEVRFLNGDEQAVPWRKSGSMSARTLIQITRSRLPAVEVELPALRRLSHCNSWTRRAWAAPSRTIPKSR